MDTFNLKKYLVENKLTYQEKMKAKAKEMKEAETSTQTKDKEKGHQAPKDKSKQGSSTIKEQDDMYLGIGDHGFYDQNDRPMKNFDFEYDEEEYDDFDDFISKYPNQKWFDMGNDKKPFDYRPGRNYWDIYKNKYGGPFKLRKRKMGEGGPLNEGKVYFGEY